MSVPPPLSVLLPVRDGAPFLDEALRSLTEQSFADFEIVAVDDGSRDATAEILEDRARRDLRMRVLHQEASGIVAALERARREARGAILARMDADDVAHPDRFRLQMDLLASDPALAAVGSRIRYFPRDAVRDGARRYEAWINATAAPDEVERDLFIECPLAHPTFFMRAEAVDAVGGYRDRGWPEDYDLILRLWRGGGRFAKVPRVLLEWREGPRRLSRTHARYGEEAFRRCKVHHLKAAFFQGAGEPGGPEPGGPAFGASPLRPPRAPAARGGVPRGVVLWGAGPVGKGLSRELRRAGIAVRAFAEVDPRKLGQEIHGAPVLDQEGALGLEGVLHLAAVGQPGARETLRSLLAEAGLREMWDFVVMA